MRIVRCLVPTRAVMSSVAASLKRPLSTSPAVIGAPGEIKLNETEEQLAQLLLDVKREYKLDDTDIRFVGGWVRDKLLKKESQDVDVTLSNMMGKEFAEYVHSYAKLSGRSDVSRVGVIKVNPAQSKHLETATVQINGQWIDFVNLRSESYGEGSRIPGSITFGSPLEDAERRDITINALFYNIATRCVEDHLGTGLEDLKTKRIRTPIDPIRTFMDDPLRMLRVVRFAARFQFDIEEGTWEALRQTDCQQAFRGKVSRERVGIELNKMLAVEPDEHDAMARAVYGAQLIYKSQLYRCITMESSEASGAYADFISTHAGRIETRLRDLGQTCDLRILGYCSLIGENGLEEVIEKNKPVLRAHHIVRDAFKLPNSDVNSIIAIFRAIKDFPSLHELSFTDDNAKRCVARMIRGTGQLWTAAATLIAAERERTAPGGQVDAWLEQFFDHVVRVCRIDNCWKQPPLLDGKEIAAALNERPGPIVGKAGDLLFFYQIDHPNATKDDALSALPGLVSKAGLR